MNTNTPLLKGTIVRYDHGSTALAIITTIHPGHGGSVAYYGLIHCLGGTLMAYHEKVTIATGEEVKTFWAKRKEWKCAEIVIDDVPQSPEGFAAYEREMHRNAANSQELQRQLERAETFKTLERIAGYWQNGSNETVRFGSDEATKEWYVSVGQPGRSKSGYGKTLEAAVADFKAQHPSHFED